MTDPARIDPRVVAVVAVGGAVGAVGRWSLGEAFPSASDAFPWTTFAVNLVGTLLLAALPAAGFVRRRALLPPALGTGVLGGFTTLSGYSEETRALLADGHLGLATAYLLGTLGACLVAVAVVDRLLDRRPEVGRERAEFLAEEGDL